MTQKARPFPSGEAYTPAIRQYLNRLSNLESDTDTQFQAITARLGTLESEIDGARVDISQLQQESASHAAAIDLLNSRYDSLDIDLEGALQAIEILSVAMDQVEAVNATQTADIATLQENVADLQMAADLAVDSLAALDGRITAVEGRVMTAEIDIQALRYADAALASLLDNTQIRLDAFIEAQRQVNGWRLPLSDAILGTVPKVVSVLLLPAGEYAAPSAYLGCPTTPGFTAILTLIDESDGTVLATVSGPGTMAWQPASAGFTLTDNASIELHLVGSSAPAVALVKGFMLTQA